MIMQDALEMFVCSKFMHKILILDPVVKSFELKECMAKDNDYNKECKCVKEEQIRLLNNTKHNITNSLSRTTDTTCN